MCAGNSCRSQMAEALVNHLLGDRWEAYSAGVKPEGVNRRAVQVMAELGIDISTAHSKPVSEFAGRDDIDLAITVCDTGEACPTFPWAKRQMHLPFADPAPFTDQPDEVALPIFRRTCDEIRTRLVPILRDYCEVQ